MIESISYFERLTPRASLFRRLPLSRDQLILLLVAINQLFLGLDTLLAHGLNGTIRPNEWIPIIFGFGSGLLLLIAGVIAFRQRQLATLLATLVFVSSIIVGVLGAYFHIVRGTLPTAPLGQRLTITLLIWGPPTLAPMMFALIGLMGISAAWLEDPPDSGVLMLGRNRHLRLPYPKTNAYLFMVSVGAMVALISSTLDHARAGFDQSRLWLPLTIGILGIICPAVLGALKQPSRLDIMVYAGIMGLMLLTGIIGAWLHLDANLVAGATFVPERFLRGAPLLGPLLYANVGLIGLVVLLPSAA